MSASRVCTGKFWVVAGDGVGVGTAAVLGTAQECGMHRPSPGSAAAGRLCLLPGWWAGLHATVMSVRCFEVLRGKKQSG